MIQALWRRLSTRNGAWLLVIGVAMCFLWLAGPWLVVWDAPQPADAIVVIGGDNKPARIAQAAHLYEAGYAPVVILSAGTLVEEGGRWMAEAEVLRRQAVAAGIPERALVLETDSFSTYENAVQSKRVCERIGCRNALLVTSPYHSRRALHFFRSVWEPEIQVIGQAAPLTSCQLCWPWHPEQVAVIGYEYYNWFRYWTYDIPRLN